MVEDLECEHEKALKAKELASQQMVEDLECEHEKSLKSKGLASQQMVEELKREFKNTLISNNKVKVLSGSLIDEKHKELEII
jgi:hypothetical protein